MSVYQSIGTASARNTDRVMEALVAGLELEFGRGAGKALAHRFLEAEEADFRRDARVEERWVSACESTEQDEFELDRIAIWGRLDGKWFCATMLVDGEGQAHGMMGCRTFRSLVRAREAMLHAHWSAERVRGDAAWEGARVFPFFEPFERGGSERGETR